MHEAAAHHSTPRFAVVGGFTTERRKARGDGLHTFRIDPVTGAWKQAFHLPDLVNPSFLILDPNQDRIYSVHGDGDFASAFSIDAESGGLRLLGQAATGGVNGVHPAIDPSDQFLVVANYASGSVSVLPITADGRLEPFIHKLDLPGEPGPHRTEQASSHPHHVVFDPSGRFLLVPDKGLDRVFILKLDPGSGRLHLHGSAAMRPGAGPRHIAFHPSLPIAFVVNEIDSTVAACRWDEANGILTPMQLRSTLPPHFFGASTAAAIVVSPCGRHVYASNRGQDGVVHFNFDSARNTLETVGWVSSQGRDPRFICLGSDGKTLLVANEQSDNIVSFDIDGESGALTFKDRAIGIASPATIVFI
ncbi:MAG: lactonase family protein [Rhodomicrobium sp.]